MTGGARAGFGEGSGESGRAEAPGPRPGLRSCLAASASGPSLRRRHPLWVTHCTLVLCSSVVAISQVVPASCEPQGAAARSGVRSGHREAVTPPRVPQRGAPARHPCVVLDADRWGARYSGSLGPGAACPPRPALGPALARSSWSPLPCSYRSLSKDTGGGDPRGCHARVPAPRGECLARTSCLVRAPCCASPLELPGDPVRGQSSVVAECRGGDGRPWPECDRARASRGLYPVAPETGLTAPPRSGGGGGTCPGP